MRHGRYTKAEKRAIVDYALEVRGVKSIDTCPEEIGITPTSLSSRLKQECEAYRIFTAEGKSNTRA